MQHRTMPPDGKRLLPRSTFSTMQMRELDDVSEADIEETWSEAMSVFFSPGRITDPELRRRFNPAGDIDGYIDSFLFPGFMSIQIAASGQHFSRSSPDIARDGFEAIAIHCCQRGEIHCGESEIRLRVRAGGVALVDMTRSVKAVSTGFNSHTLMMPRSIIEDLLPEPDQQHLRYFDPRAPLTKMLFHHIITLHGLGSNFTDEEALAAGEATSALIKAVLDTSEDSKQAAAPIIERTQLVEIRRYIDKNFHRPELSPELIAQSTGLSRAGLYRLMSPLGGVHNFITNRRLKHAFHSLTRRQARTKSISMLAFDLGFQSESTFRRTFKEAFGMTPKEVRDLGVRAYSEYYGDSRRQAELEKSSLMPVGDLLYKRWMYDLFS